MAAEIFCCRFPLPAAHGILLEYVPVLKSLSAFFHESERAYSLSTLICAVLQTVQGVLLEAVLCLAKTGLILWGDLQCVVPWEASRTVIFLLHRSRKKQNGCLE